MAATASEHRVTLAGRKLEAHLQKRNETIYAWCERHWPKHNSIRHIVTKIVEGERWAQISADTCLALIRAVEKDRRESGLSGGGLAIDDFGSATAKPLAS